MAPFFHFIVSTGGEDPSTQVDRFDGTNERPVPPKFRRWVSRPSSLYMCLATEGRSASGTNSSVQGYRYQRTMDWQQRTAGRSRCSFQGRRSTTAITHLQGTITGAGHLLRHLIATLATQLQHLPSSVSLPSTYHLHHHHLTPHPNIPRAITGSRLIPVIADIRSLQT